MPNPQKPLNTARSVRSFTLYGANEAAPAWKELVHLEQIPERSGRFNWEIDLHFHEGLLQLLYLTGGELGTAFMDGTQWSLQPPCLIVVPERVVHGFHFHPQTDGPVITAAQKPLEALASLIHPELQSWLRTPQVITAPANNRLAQPLLPMFEAIEREFQLHEHGMNAGMTLLAGLLMQCMRLATAASNTAQHTPSRKALQIERFRALLNTHIRHRQPVQFYADMLGITPGQLSRLTREVLGISAQEMLNARTIYEAQRELAYSQRSIKQIASELGFQDEAYFCRFFKKHTQQRPGEFRAQALRQFASF